MADSPLDTLLSLHPQVFIVLLLEFLNSYRNFGLRSMVYNFLCDEYQYGDEDAGALLGVRATIVTIFGFCGSVITDIIGVRRTAMLSICLSLIGRGMLVVTRSQFLLKISLLGIHPIGEALLTTGLYRVALKKMTTEDTRPLAFAISYSVYNCAGGVANFLIDAFKNMPDITVFGAVYTGPRLFLATSWVALFIALLLVIFALKDVTVVEEGYEEEDRDGVELVSEATTDSSSTPAAAAAVADVHVSEHAPLCGGSNGDDGSKRSFLGRLRERRKRALSRTRAVPTVLRSTEGMRQLGLLANQRGTCAACRAVVLAALRDLLDLLQLRALWRTMLMGLAGFVLGIAWSVNEMVLPPFFKRTLGETTPIYSIISINFWGCMLLPPLVGAYLSKRDAFSVILPGMWLMAMAPVTLVLSPTLPMAALWEVLLTLGEVFWSPRQIAWTASLAPTGREGLFFAVASTRDLLTPIMDVFLGLLNGALNPNCPTCQDAYGHFCGQPISNSTMNGCASQHGLCTPPPQDGWMPTASGLNITCPLTCFSCPGYELPLEGRPLWFVILLVSMAGPFIVWVALPFLRGYGTLKGGCYGVLDWRRFCGLQFLKDCYGGVDRAKTGLYS